MDLKQRTTHRGEDGELYKTVRPGRDSVKVWKDETDDGVEATHIRVPISSTSEDRDGDEFTEEGLDHMVEQLQAGDVPMFMDHGISPDTGFQDYRALEAIGGWKDAEKEDGVVYGIGALDPDKEEAKELAQTLKNGVVPVGWSVGFIPHETESKDGDSDGERFLEHDMLEVSSVGIPSNPDGVSSSLAQAAKSLGRRRGVDVDAEQLADSMTEQLERHFDDAHEDALAAVRDAAEAYESEHDDADLEGFATYAVDERGLDEVVVSSVLQQYADDVDKEGETDDGVIAWVDEQLDADGDGEGDGEDDEEEEESTDGDGDDEGGDEDDEEEESSADDDGGDTITTEAIASAVGDAVGRELETHREIMLEELGAKPVETDSDDEGGEGDDEGGEDDEESSVDDSSTVSSSPDPRAIASFGRHDDSKDTDSADDVEKETGEPASPTFNPGTDQ